MSDFCVFLDAGHGGLDPSGGYTTAPAKQFFHDTGTFHNGGWFYEGVWNRRLTARVEEKLASLGIPFVRVYHPWLDMPLQWRVDQANWYHRNFKKGVFVSSHANASGNHRARGFEVYTSPGTTRSDRLAELLWEQVEGLLGDRIRMRSDTSDGDHDKEARFFVLTKTLMPAILIEHLFFDQPDDARLLMDEEVVERFAEAQVRAILRFAG